ncbi:MAG: hypothetical protein ACP5HD_10870, partial [Thermoproteus sp.]
KLVLVSSYRNSKTCPIHGEEMSFPLGPKMGLCPRGHWVHRDVVAVLNMLRKAAEELEERYTEAVKQALSAVDEKTLEEWSRQVLEAEGPASRPDALARAGLMIPAGRGDGDPWQGMRAPMSRPEGRGGAGNS